MHVVSGILLDLCGGETLELWPRNLSYNLRLRYQCGNPALPTNYLSVEQGGLVLTGFNFFNLERRENTKL